MDLGKRLVIPVHILETQQRPGMILVSERSKQLTIIELTVPSEERIDVSSEMMKYAPIAVSYTHLTLPTICSV